MTAPHDEEGTVEARPWDGRCHMLVGWPDQSRCGRPEDHERHVPGSAEAHVYSPAPPDMDDPYEYEVELPTFPPSTPLGPSGLFRCGSCGVPFWTAHTCPPMTDEWLYQGGRRDDPRSYILLSAATKRDLLAEREGFFGDPDDELSQRMIAAFNRSADAARTASSVRGSDS